MANATVSFLGQSNLAGDTKALFLKVYAGEVLAAFASANMTLDKHRVRTIQHGKSASFPIIGKASAQYHTPGQELTGSAIPHAETIVTIDDLLVSDVFIANIDEAMNHYDVRSQYSIEQGRVLSKTLDENVLKVMINAARSTALVSGGNGGSKLVDANFRTSGASLAAGFFAAAQTLDEKNVPEEERYGYLLPAQYYLLSQDTNVLNKLWDGKGSYSEGAVLKVAGIDVVKTNHLPQTNITTGNIKYQGDFTNTAGVITHKEAVGTVKLLDLAMESDYDIRRQGTLMVAKYALGTGILRPEASVELSVL